MRLEHTNLTVSDLERSIAFYHDALGFDVRWRGQAVGTTRMVPAAHVGPAGDEFYCALFESEKPGRAPYDYATPGFNHFGIVVDDLAAVTTRVEAAGAKVHMSFEYDPGRHVYFFDPDGTEIELIEY